MPLAEIKGLSDRAETDYYTSLPVGYEKTGQALYNWLDKSDRVLANALKEPHSEGLIIAIATDKGLAHLPWELLHDGECFLVNNWTLDKEGTTVRELSRQLNRSVSMVQHCLKSLTSSGQIYARMSENGMQRVYYPSSTVAD